MNNPYKTKYISPDDMTINKFAKGMAKAIMDSKSSHCYFIFQLAFGVEYEWNMVEDVCNKILEEATNGKEESK